MQITTTQRSITADKTHHLWAEPIVQMELDNLNNMVMICILINLELINMQRRLRYTTILKLCRSATTVSCAVISIPVALNVVWWMKA